MNNRKNRADKKSGGQGDVPAADAESVKTSKITFELIGDDHLNVLAEWPKGTDIKPFAHLLLYICQGKLVGPISAAVAIHGSKIDENNTAGAIHSLLQDAVKQSQSKAAVQDAEDDDEPIVCPTQAIRMNMKPFQG